MERQFLASSVVPQPFAPTPLAPRAFAPSAYSAVLEPTKSRSRAKSRRSGEIALRDRAGRTIEIDSDDEDHWDRGAAQKRVWGQKSGPVRERPVDDLLISFRDLFPCLAPLFDCCGCQRRKPRRQLVRSAAPTPDAGPRVEQVCLDCGNVLDVRHVPGTVAMDMFDRGTAERHQAFLALTPPPMQTFEGYETWTAPQGAAPLGGSIALPQFEVAPARVLKNTPTSCTLHVEEEFAVDDTGHIKLPKFKEP